MSKVSSSRNSEEDESSPSDEALEEVNNHIQEAFAILKRETNKVRMEKEAFDEAAKKLEHIHFSSMLQLNVGGNLFSTSLATLNKDPGMFSKGLRYLYRCKDNPPPPPPPPQLKNSARGTVEK